MNDIGNDLFSKVDVINKPKKGKINSFICIVIICDLIEANEDDLEGK